MKNSLSAIVNSKEAAVILAWLAVAMPEADVPLGQIEKDIAKKMLACVDRDELEGMELDIDFFQEYL